MKKVKLTGQLDGLLRGLNLLLPELPLEFSEDGIPVEVVKGDCLRVDLDARGGRIEYAERVQFFRALSLLCQEAGEGEVHRVERPCFVKNGVMFDVSRNAVLKPETLYYFFRKMALMGLNLGMMYTEETYEIPSQPYFGYLRGRYSQEELRKLDDYAYDLGIELIPCIQTLGHLERMLHWPVYDEVKDTEAVLLVGEEKTYGLLDEMIREASAPYRSRRIHVGMDEAWDLGLGNYLKKNGYHSGFEIMNRHLSQLEKILKKYGLKAMMWSDMYFRIASSTGFYYDLDAVIPPEVLASAPKDIELVYWDYYNDDPAVYDAMIRRHQQFAAPTVFAGGVWTWSGPSANYDTTLSNTIPALTKCRELDIREVFLTAWGDNGAECNTLAALYGMQVYAEFGYTGGYTEAWCKARFAQCVRADAQAFLDLSLFDSIPGVPTGNVQAANPSKYLLYEDTLAPLFTEDTKGILLSEYYGWLSKKYADYRRENPEFDLLFAFYEDLGRALSQKCRWREQAGEAVLRGDRKAAASLAAFVPEMMESMRALKNRWRELWFCTNKPYGFEILDGRLGGILARMESAQWRMEAFAAGEIQTIEELAEKKLPFFPHNNGVPGRCDRWDKIISASRVLL